MIGVWLEFCAKNIYFSAKGEVGPARGPAPRPCPVTSLSLTLGKTRDTVDSQQNNIRSGTF